jgi:hypothetical protein
MLGRVLLAAAVTAALSACTVERKTVVAGSDACTTYGFQVGTPQYQHCQTREADARKLGRLPAGTTDAQLNAESQSACMSYGLAPYTEAYQRCVNAEYAYRRPA